MTRSKENEPNEANMADTAEVKDENEGDDSPILSPSDRRRVRKNYRQLMNSVVTRFDDLDVSEIDGGAFQTVMKTTDKLFAKVDTPQEALLDAKVFKHLSILTRNQVEFLSTGSQKFSAAEFADKLANKMADLADDRSVDSLRPKHFSCLGHAVQHMMPVAPALKFMLGSLAKDFDVEERQQRRSRAHNVPEGTSNATQTYVDDGSKPRPHSGAGLTQILVESTYKQLVGSWRSNEREPICYFRFVIDPASFGRTVENIFHVAFLVKDKKARIFFDGDDDDAGLPRIEPIRKGEAPVTSQQQQGDDQADDGESRKQVITAIDMDDWEALVNALNIKKALINHDNLRARSATTDSDGATVAKRSKNS